MLALVNSRVITMEMDEDRQNSWLVHDPGWIAVGHGKIMGIGAGSLPSVFKGDADIIDLKGKTITPGLIDAHTHVGILEEAHAKEGDDANETSEPVTPHLRALDAVNPRDMAFKAAIESGITCVCCLPGSTNIIGGLGVVLKTHGSCVDEMVVGEGGLKAAFGENPKRCYGEKKTSPITRMAVAGLLRESLVQADNWRRKNNSWNEEERERDLHKEILVRLLDGEITMRAHAHRADDILTAMRIANEFNLSLVLDHCTEGHYIAEGIASSGHPVVYGPMFLGRVKQELEGMSEATPLVLNQLGVKMALATDHPEISIKYLPLCASILHKWGLSWKDAFSCITINPADILGLGHRIGSLAPQKDADIVVWDGDPLDIHSGVEMVIIDGDVVFKRDGKNKKNNCLREADVGWKFQI